jgi:HD-GYP domain-containing protein (c-di-GMP phosphodiesterase class II)
MQRLEVDRGVGFLLDTLGRWHPPTRAHSERVSVAVAQLAEMAGWSPRAAAVLARAGLLHDMGKLRVPVAILDKPGPLDHLEMATMRRHVWFSARIAQRLLSPRQTQWIAAHHERPDGLGYPLGLRGRSVPEGAALLALADAWDVMTHERPYSPAMSEAEALAECTALAARQFTVSAVQALHAVQLVDQMRVAA